MMHAMTMSAPMLRFDPAKVAISFDGNSLVDPRYSDICTSLQKLAPLNNNFVISNTGISGQVINQMRNSAADIDATWVAGKTNVLLIWEITNTIHNSGKTGLQACSELQSYISERQAVHPWIPVVLTCLPRGDLLGGWSATDGELQAQAANAYLHANYRAMGARALVEVRRPGGPFDFTDVTNAANFPSSLWTDKTHPNSAGKAIIATYIADVLMRLRAR